MTRFGKSSPFWQKIDKTLAIFKGSFSLEPTLAISPAIGNIFKAWQPVRPLKSRQMSIKVAQK